MGVQLEAHAPHTHRRDSALRGEGDDDEYMGSDDMSGLNDALRDWKEHIVETGEDFIHEFLEHVEENDDQAMLMVPLLKRLADAIGELQIGIATLNTILVQKEITTQKELDSITAVLQTWTAQVQAGANDELQKKVRDVAG